MLGKAILLWEEGYAVSYDTDKWNRRRHHLDGDVRKQLVTLCRRSRACVLGWPRDWRPQQVKHPTSGEWFTERGAWHFIAELLDAGHPAETIVLTDPPSKTAYVLHVSVGPGTPNIYIKVQLGSGEVIGRSFHYSEIY